MYIWNNGTYIDTTPPTLPITLVCIGSGFLFIVCCVLCTVQLIWWIERECVYGIGVLHTYVNKIVVSLKVCACVLNTSGLVYCCTCMRMSVCVYFSMYYMYRFKNVCLCLCECVCFLCLVVTHFFDNAHFALKHVLVDFLLSKLIRSDQLRLARSLRSCVLLLPLLAILAIKICGHNFCWLCFINILWTLFSLEFHNCQLTINSNKKKLKQFFFLFWMNLFLARRPFKSKDKRTKCIFEN